MKKRVCHISYNHDAFDDRIYWKELIALTEAGYETIHICIGDEDKDFITNEGVRIIQIKSASNSKNIWLQRFKYILFRKNETIDRILEKAKDLEADVYHYHDLQINAIVKDIKNFPNQPKIIYDCHEAYHLLLLEGKNITLFRKIVVSAISKWEIKNAKYCNFIITTDQYTNSFFSKTVTCIPSQIIYNYSYFFKPYDCAPNKKYDFIYTGLINKERGMYEMVELINELKTDLPLVSLLLIGSFENDLLKQDLEAFIQKRGLTSNITFHPQVSFSAIQYFYEQARIGLGLFHATPKYKTFVPIKLFEYMAFGLPIIFTDQGPSAEIIKQEKCGALVELDRPHSIKNVALIMLTQKKLYDELSLNGRNAIIKKYSWQKEKSRLINIYSQLLNA